MNAQSIVVSAKKVFNEFNSCTFCTFEEGLVYIHLNYAINMSITSKQIEAMCKKHNLEFLFITIDRYNEVTIGFNPTRGE